MTVEERLKRLEMQNHRLTWALVLVAVIGLALISVAIGYSAQGLRRLSDAVEARASDGETPPPIPNPGQVLPPSEMPELLTVEQIAALSADEARNRMIEVAKAKKATSDEEQQKKLMEQFRMLMARVREG